MTVLGGTGHKFYDIVLTSINYFPIFILTNEFYNLFSSILLKTDELAII